MTKRRGHATRARSRTAPSGPSSPEALRAAVEAQIVPRLASLSPGGRAAEPTSCPRLEARDLRRLADLACGGDVDALWQAMLRLLAGGGTEVSALLDIVTPVARLVGTDWEEDRRTWLEVTVAAATLQQLVCVLGRERSFGVEERGGVVLFAAPGEQHILSIHVLGEVLRRVGWRAHVEPSLTLEGVLEIISREPTQMVGMTVSSPDRMHLSREDVEQIKAASIDPRMVVALGGAIDVMDYAARIGAAFCGDARDAVALLEASTRMSPRALAGRGSVGRGFAAAADECAANEPSAKQSVEFSRGLSLLG